MVEDFEIGVDALHWDTGSGVASVGELSFILVTGGVEVTASGLSGTVLLAGMTSVDVNDYGVLLG